MSNKAQFLTEYIVAHRGYHNDKIPENSLESYKRAIENGYAIEIDLHLLKDGNIAIMHDDDTKRMTGEKRVLRESTYDDIKNLKLKNGNEKIPLLQEVLDLVNGKVPLLIEFKYDLKAGLLENEAMKVLKKYKGLYAMQSFNPMSLNWFRKNCPEIPRGQLSCDFENDKDMDFIKSYMLTDVRFNFLTSPDFISYNINSLPRKRIENLSNKGILIGAWTIRKKENYEKAKKIDYINFYICENMEKYIKTEKTCKI